MHSGNFHKLKMLKNVWDKCLIKHISFCRNLNIYEACVPDRMHHIDLSLFKYQLEFTQEILKKIGGLELQKEFDDCFRQIPHFSGLKLLSKLGQLKVITAADYWHIMKIVIFSLDGIFEGDWNGITCDELCDVYAKFSKMYMISRKESYTENELKVFEVNYSQ
jgi:hypothetical protein